MLKYFRSHLAWKVFLTYVLVILVGILVLATATSFSAPAAFNRHMADMSAILSNNNRMGNSQMMVADLFNGYRAAVTEAISLAAVAALIAAVIASFFISWQVVFPIQRMMLISQRVADGEYGQRLNVSGICR